MKNFTKIFMVLIPLAFVLCTNLTAADYLVSGAGTTSVNGLYFENGTNSGKPKYTRSDGGIEYKIQYTSSVWAIMEGVNVARYYVLSTSNTPPLTGWVVVSGNGLAPPPTLELFSGSKLDYSSSAFYESEDDDGTMTTSITISFASNVGNNLTGSLNDDFVTDGKVTISNLPTGLTAHLIRSCFNTLEFSLSGAAIAHTHADEISNLTIVFQNSAFTGGNALAVDNNSKSDFSITYRETLHVPAGYGTIAAAIAAATHYDIINIAAGQYTEPGLVVNKTLIFKGTGANSTFIQAATTYNTATNRVISINSGLTKVCFYDLTIRYGKIVGLNIKGGGINTSSPLEMFNCIITKNIATNSGGYNIGYGGGIYSQANVLLNSCLISDNIKNGTHHNYGGGLHVESGTQLTIINSTFTGNSVSTPSPADEWQSYYGSYGSAITVRIPSKIIDCTIYGNTSSNATSLGQSYRSGVMFQSNSTIKNSIIYGNTGHDLYRAQGTINVYNCIIGNSMANSGQQAINGVSQNVSTSNPMLLALADNGGPTWTCALQSASPAIDAGTTGGDIPDADQRGYYYSTCPRDIGAYEYNGQLTLIEPIISVQGNGYDIPNRSTSPCLTRHTDFGTTGVPTGTIARTFTILNTGPVPLSLSGSSPFISISGTHAADFSVTSPPASTIASGNSTTFKLTFQPSALGIRTAILSFEHDDCGSTPFEFAIMGTGAESQTIYVDIDHTTGTHDGTSWGTAYQYLQDALHHPGLSSGDQIWVAAGVYYPDEGTGYTDNARDSSFTIPSGVKVYGGFAGIESDVSSRDWESNVCTLSGDLDQTTGTTGNSFHVVRFTNASDQTLLDGFTLTGGNADASSLPNSCGGGIYNDGSGSGNSSNPQIANCTISGNSAKTGGGLFNNGSSSGTSSPVLSNCTISGNSATGSGGGLHNDANSGISSPVLTNCIINGNNAAKGGGLDNFSANGASSPILTNCIISGNSASNQGGGLFNTGFSGGTTSPVLINCKINGNSASTKGGGMYIDCLMGTSSPVFTNCTFRGNSASNNGGGLYNYNFMGTSTPALTNCIIYGNSTTGGQVYNQSAIPSYSYCDIEGSGGSSAWVSTFGTDGGDNIDSNPLFINASQADLRLHVSSPAINTGDNSANSEPYDLAGNNRIQNSTIDMGAYEGGIDLAPTTQATNIQFSSIQATQFSVSWTRGNGDSCAVFIFPGTSGNAAPVFNTYYTANTGYAAGDQIGASGWYCIYRGTGASVTVSGLAVGTGYRVHVCEFLYGSLFYNSTASTNNPNNQSTLNCANPSSGGTIAADQTICYGTTPAGFTSSVAPSGHAGTLEYKWQESATSASSGFLDIASSNSDTYSPGALSANTWYKRLARVDCMAGWTGAAESNVVAVTVYDDFTPGEILTTGETICYGGDPVEIGNSTTASGGDGTITYKWESSIDGFATAGSIIAGATASTFDPPTGLTATTSYRRYAHDGTCNTSFEVSTGTWLVTVYDDFTPGEILTTGETICYGGNPVEIGSSTDASGGDGTITYKWESSTDGFATAGSIITGATASTFDPPAGLTTTTSYRRYAHDGTCNTSFETSTGTWLVTVYDDFTPGEILTTGETICYGGDPVEIGSSTIASGGDGTITYQWESSTDGFATAGSILAGAISSTFDPPAGLTTTTSYRRYAHDGTCNTSFETSIGTWLVTVYDDFTPGEILTTGETICYGGDPVEIGSSTAASGGDATITYQWESSTDGFATTGTLVVGATSSTFDPPTGLTATTSYRRYAHDGTCNTSFETSTGTWLVTVYDDFTPGEILTTGETICYNDDPVEIGNSTDASGGNESISYQWQKSTTSSTTGFADIGGATASSCNPPSGLTETTWYRRMAKDGTCNTTFTASTGVWKVLVNPLPVMSCPTYNDVCIDAAEFALAGASPLNGTYSGSGVSDGHFNPATAGAGTHTINYSFTDGNGCTNDCDFDLTVSPLASVNAGPDASICETGCYLNGTVSYAASLHWSTYGDGSFSNANIEDPHYTPGASDLAAGLVILQLSATPSISPCINLTFDQVVLTIVQDKPVVDAGFDGSMCATGSYTFSGSAAQDYSTLLWITFGDGTFDSPYALHPVYTPGPNDLALGLVTFKLTAAPIAPCAGIAIDQVTIYIIDEPMVAAGTDATICETGSYYIPDFTANNYSTLAWSGGDGTFDDASLLNPTYTPGTGDIAAGSVQLCLTANPLSPCTAADQKCITLSIQSLPTADAGSNGSTCFHYAFTLSSDAATHFSTLAWSHNGNGSLDFDNALHPTYTPTQADAGNTVTITLQANAIDPPCTGPASDYMELYVYQPPTVNCPANQNVCLNAAAVDLTTLGASPSGGIFQGPGVTSNEFDPSVGVGPYTITYTYTDGNGCVGDCIFDIAFYPEFSAGEIGTEGESICYNGDPAPIMASVATTIDNGTIINSYGTGANGSDESIIRSGGNTYGWSMTQSSNYFVTDDFTLTSSTTINSVEFKGYQTNSPTTSTFTGLYFQIWDGEPGAGGNIIWGDLTTDRMTSTSFSNVYRVSTAGGGVARPVMNIYGDNLNIQLNPGTYWIEWATTGTLASGPWVPPTISATGNAKQRNANTYLPIINGGSGVELPFKLTGIGSAPATGGDGIISYQWQQSTTSAVAGFTDIPGATAAGYDPPAGLTTSTWYRRMAKDATCCSSFEVSTGTWLVTVNPLPTVTCPQNQDACIDAAVIDLTTLGATPTGGTFSGTGVSSDSFDPATAGVGSHTITYSYTDPVTGCSNECTFTVTVHAKPVITDAPMVYSEDLGTTWDPIGGSFANGLNLCMDNNPLTQYLLSTVGLVSTENLKVGVLNPFLLKTASLLASADAGAAFYAWWALKGVNSTASGWQGLMWQIINGNAPICYLYFDGADHMLVDGLKHQLYPNQLPYPPLEMPGDYPLYNYEYEGTVESGWGCISDPFSIFLRTVDPELYLSATPYIIGNGEIVLMYPVNVDIWANVPNQVNPSYLWDYNAETNPFISINDYGTYNVTVTDMGCEVSASLTVNEKQDIQLRQGWGIFSTYINTAASFDVLMADLVSTNNVVVKDEDGNVFISYNGAYSNGLANHTMGEGYQYYMSTPNQVLTVVGGAIDPATTTLGLDLGYNFMGYLRRTSAPVVQLMAPIASVIDIMKDEDGQVYWYVPSLGIWINQIGDLWPGKGYQLKLLAATTYTYPANTVPFSKSDIYVAKPSYFATPVSTGNNMTLGIPENAWSMAINVGDELGVFNQNGDLVGSGVYDNDNMAVSLWGDNEVTKQTNGLANKQVYTLQLWNSLSGLTETLVVTEWVEGNGTYGENNIAIVGKLAIVPGNELSLDNYPNPFKDVTTIEFSIPEDGKVRVELFNSIGKRLEVITDRDYPAGAHEVQFKAKNLAVGTYFIQLESNGQTLNKAVQVVR